MNHRWTKTIVSSLCALTIFIIPFFRASAAFFTFETQYEYDAANIAWLTDLVVKEDMSSVDGLAQSCELTAKPAYPYTETPESFAKNASYYASLYTLQPGSQRYAYLYFFDLLGTQANGVMAGEISDDDIRIYLESVGIDFPEDPSADERIMARALYTAKISGAFAGATPGTTLEEAAVEYLAEMTGMNIDSLRDWLPEENVLSLDAYLLAASRLALWTNGYDVEDITDEDEIFRLIAVMTMDKLGISTDSDQSFDQLKYKYMAAMLSTKYGVSVDSERLAAAIADDALPFYLLQLIGRDYGVSVREDNCTYEEAFELVAENTGVFDIEPGEFYADITDYELALSYRRSSIWVYPTAYASNNSGYGVAIDVNGTPVRNGYFTEVPVDPMKASQRLAITVTATSSDDKTTQCVYYIDLKQGTQAAPQNGETPAAHSGTEANPFISSESLVAQIMSSFGLDSSAVADLGASFFTLALPTQNVVGYISPSFDAETLFDDTQTPAVQSVPVLSDEEYKAVLDQIGNLSDVSIRGIDGAALPEHAESFRLADYVTF